MKSFCTFWLIVLLAACGNLERCDIVVAEYDFECMLPLQKDTIDRNTPVPLYYYISSLVNKLESNKVTRLNPLFVVGVHIYRIDTSGITAVLKPAVSDFQIDEWINGSFDGSDDFRVNLAIVEHELFGFAGGIALRPQQPGFYLIELISQERFRSYSGSNYRCSGSEQLNIRLKERDDPHAENFNQLMRASTYKSTQHRLVWVR